MVKRGLDRVLGEGNWGPPKWAPGNYPKLSMSYPHKAIFGQVASIK
jgi:hypothetical protein